jgi:S1-C subfamily serine protease
VAEDAFTAATLGTERLGNGTVIGATGLVLTMGYLIMEAEEVVLTRNDGARVAAHVLGSDPVTGSAWCRRWSRSTCRRWRSGTPALRAGGRVIVAGGGGRAHAAAGQVIARMPFAGYWEYLLDNAIMTEPAHPHWSGAALIGADGELLGVGSLHLARQTADGRATPINMFVPSEVLPPIVDDLAHGRPATRRGPGSAC